MADFDKQRLNESSNGSNNQLPLVLSILAVILAVIGVIIGAVSLSQNKETNYYTIVPDASSTPSQAQAAAGYYDDKIWTIAIGHEAASTEYLDEVSGQIKGFDVDIVNAVCKIARKNCRLTVDVYSRCWDSEIGQQQRGGEGLFSKYYDACTAWLHSYARGRTFQFSDPFAGGTAAVFIVKEGNPDGFNPQDIDGKTIGFIDGFINDEYCLARELPGFKGDSIPVAQVKHYVTREDFEAAIAAREVDAGFDSMHSWINSDKVDVVAVQDLSCFIAGRSMMTRKDTRLWEWWNPAFETLMATTEYRNICKDLLEQHGHIPGPQPEDICFGYK